MLSVFTPKSFNEAKRILKVGVGQAELFFKVGFLIELVKVTKIPS